jgi:hypothetical protein
MTAKINNFSMDKIIFIVFSLFSFKMIDFSRVPNLSTCTRGFVPSLSGYVLCASCTFFSPDKNAIESNPPRSVPHGQGGVRIL